MTENSDVHTFRERRHFPALLDAAIMVTAAAVLARAEFVAPAALALLLAGAALQLSVKKIKVPTAARQVALAVASLSAPGVLLVQYHRNQMRDIPLLAAASALIFLLVLGRMALMVAEQHRIATADTLTGLCTRRAFQERLHALRPGRPAAVILLDIDRFKRVNDAFGHPAGDRVLQVVADRLRDTAGPGVTVCRYGGEEFSLLVPGADASRAAELAERLRKAVGAAALELGDGVLRFVTISAGTALIPADTEDPNDLIPLADRALYTAKRTGRDRVVAAGAAPPLTIAEG
ncbi:GGDEF domain-containing protein, partial [Dactylosporangium sp. NPDC051541]|uniref:GGDEF domain-containing protein n=1 Tax=Dactylosporangium sp. NPDC051541 TaxID=3363977 RepID=UPI0037928A3B